MKNTLHIQTQALLMVFVLFCVLCGPTLAKESTQTTQANITNNHFENWNDAAAITVLQEYMQTITDQTKKGYIPVQDRIAVFDMDGTLIGEQFPIYFEWMLFCHRILNDPEYSATEEQILAAGEVLRAARDKKIDQDIAMQKTHWYSKIFAGMTTDAFKEYVYNFIQTHADGFENLKLQDAYFRPMVDIVEYLKAHDFTVYVVTASDRDAARVMIAHTLNLPKRQIIGSDWYTKGSKQGKHKYYAYQLTADEKLIRDSAPMITSNVMGKAIQIAQEIGQKPVLAFGNSSGDFSMFTYTTYQNIYPAKAFCLIPDDATREYAFSEKAKQLIKTCEQNAWHPISMKNDFKTIYAKAVKKNDKHTPWMDTMLLQYNKRVQK